MSGRILVGSLSLADEACRMWAASAILGGLMVAIAACGGGSQDSTVNTSAGSSGRIAFDACEANAGCGLYVGTIEDGNFTRVATHGGISDHVWSPDGDRIAYITQDTRLRVVRLDGSPPTLVPTTEGTSTQPAWSPDGKKLALAVGGEKTTDIFLVDVAESKFTKLTYSDSTEYYGYRTPAWSPDGRSIAFGSTDGVHLVDADGGNARRLTTEAAAADGLSWSRDGKQIAFLSGTGITERKLGVINSDGSGRLAIAPDLSPALQKPAWSPDGSQLAFFADVDGDFEIFVVNGDGTGLRNLTNNNVNDYDLSWSPDGKRIVFVSAAGQSADVYVMNADGSEAKRVTGEALTNERAAAWAPASR